MIWGLHLCQAHDVMMSALLMMLVEYRIYLRISFCAAYIFAHNIGKNAMYKTHHCHKMTDVMPTAITVSIVIVFGHFIYCLKYHLLYVCSGTLI